MAALHIKSMVLSGALANVLILATEVRRLSSDVLACGQKSSGGFQERSPPDEWCCSHLENQAYREKVAFRLDAL